MQSSGKNDLAIRPLSYRFRSEIPIHRLSATAIIHRSIGIEEQGRGGKCGCRHQHLAILHSHRFEDGVTLLGQGLYPVRCLIAVELDPVDCSRFGNRPNFIVARIDGDGDSRDDAFQVEEPGAGIFDGDVAF